MNVNTATEEKLRELPGIGEKTTARIIASRPIGNREEFEALIPPSALVAIEKEGLELFFDIPSQPPMGVFRVEAEGPGSVTMIPDTSVQTDVGMGEPVFKEGGGGPGLTSDGAPVEVALTEAGRPIEPVLEDESGTRIRRVLHQDTQRFESLFGTGTRFLCIWNMRWGPALEALVPSDGPVQEEIAMWFASKGIEILFAHYGPSVSIGTRSKGLVPLVLFEILEEKEEEEDAIEQSVEDG